MNGILKLLLLGCGLSFLFTVLYLLIKKKISEWNVMAWLTGAVVILILSAWPEWIDWLAKHLGVSYPPSLLFLFSTMILLVLVLYQSIQISSLQSKVRQIAQHVAIQPHLPASASTVQTESLSEAHHLTLAEVAVTREPSGDDA